MPENTLARSGMCESPLLGVVSARAVPLPPLRVRSKPSPELVWSSRSLGGEVEEGPLTKWGSKEGGVEEGSGRGGGVMFQQVWFWFRWHK